jgi:glycosyltransferase involved in cell wall biosynthesis
MVFFTILIPLYNGVEFLEECMKSVLDQTYTDWEVLIGINGHRETGGTIVDHVNTIVENTPKVKVFIQGTSIKGKVESLNDLVTKTTSD